MKDRIQLKTWWVYVGPGDGRGLRHLVTGVDGGNVVTWSEPSKNPEIGGWAWLGSADDFLQQFKPCAA
jgi:hypothetical protein